MRLETERLILREWRDDDRPAFAAMVGDPCVMRYYPAPKTLAEADAWIDKMIAGLANGTSQLLAVERRIDGALLGLTGTGSIHFDIPTAPTLEIGWVLGQQYWGQGYAPEGARASLAHAFNILRAPDVVAFTARLNEPSQTVMKKLGMGPAILLRILSTPMCRWATRSARTCFTASSTRHLSHRHKQKSRRNCLRRLFNFKSPTLTV